MRIGGSEVSDFPLSKRVSRALCDTTMPSVLENERAARASPRLKEAQSERVRRSTEFYFAALPIADQQQMLIFLFDTLDGGVFRFGSRGRKLRVDTFNLRVCLRSFSLGETWKV
jgi:hypothetical protein